MISKNSLIIFVVGILLASGIFVMQKYGGEKEPVPADTPPTTTEELTTEQATTTVAQTIEELAAQYGISIVDKGELPVSTVDTSNWQTYRNEEFGFEVRYPDGLFVDAVWQPTGSLAVLFKETSSDSLYEILLLKELSFEPWVTFLEVYEKNQNLQGYKIYGLNQEVCSYYRYQANKQQWYKIFGCDSVPTEIFRSLDFFK